MLGVSFFSRLFYLTRRKAGKIFKPLMLIRCLSSETGANFVSIVALSLTNLRILRLVRLEFSPETFFRCLITRRSQVQVLSPQPQNPRTAMVLGFFFVSLWPLKWGVLTLILFLYKIICLSTLNSQTQDVGKWYSIWKGNVR